MIHYEKGVGTLAFILLERGTVPRTIDLELSIRADGNIALNKAAHAALGFTKAVEEEYDPDERLIALRPAAPECPNAYAVSVNGANRTVSLRDFARRFGIPLAPTRRYQAELQGERLVVDLKQGPIAVTERRKGRADEAGTPGGR
jgi:hypothetical protein